MIIIMAVVFLHEIFYTYNGDYFVKISEIVHNKNIAKVEVINSFGSKTWCISNVVSAGCDWLNNVAPYKWRIGTLTVSRHFMIHMSMK